jgi:hypothetical protein
MDSLLLIRTAMLKTWRLAMACQLFQWLIGGEGRHLLQLGMIGIICLLALDALLHWWTHTWQLTISEAGIVTADQIRTTTERQPKRRAA